jgi:peptide/nickel transport system permease protein
MQTFRQIGRWGIWLPPLLLLFLIGVLPVFATHDPLQAKPEDALQGPSLEHWLGTDQLGFDTWSRLLAGGRRTLSAALLATSIAVAGGLVLGMLRLSPVAGIRFAAGVLIDALLAFPGVLLALVVLTVMERGILALALAVGLANLAAYARVTGDALAVASVQPHIEGAKAIGASEWRVLSRHVLPSALPTLVSFAAVIFSWSLLYGAALSFLGLSGDPTQAEWGRMLRRGYDVISQTARLVLVPGLALAITVWLAQRFASAIQRRPG